MIANSVGNTIVTATLLMVCLVSAEASDMLCGARGTG